MLALTLVLLLCTVIFLTLFLLEKRGIRQLQKELATLNQNKELLSNKGLNLPLPDKNLEALILEINHLLEEKKATAAEYRNQEYALRQQIANISHDLRTPLTAILGYTQLAQNKTLSEAEKEDYLAVIEKRSLTLQTLLTGFYDLSRMESGEYPLEYGPVSLHKTLCTLLATFYDDFLEKSIEPQIHLDENLPDISGDPGAVTRIFTNLIQNTLKHGGTYLRIEQYIENNTIKTIFANDTTLLTQADVNMIFNRFFTADRMRTGQNTGLGLAIVKRLVEAMGGNACAFLDGNLFKIEITWLMTKNKA